jgi:heptaprenyl diphosphate synthase
MALCKKVNLSSMVGVSIVGGVAHNLGQVLVAMALFETSQIGYYMLILSITGTVAGVFVGLLSSIILKRFEKVKL